MDDFEVLEGDVHGLPDTLQFLRTLAHLDEEGDVRASDLADMPQLRERLAAGGLFRWEVQLHNCVEVTLFSSMHDFPHKWSSRF